MRLPPIFLIFMSAQLWAAGNIGVANLQQSEQLVLIMTPSWQAVEGQAQLYQRSTPHQRWRKAGVAFPVVVGQAGLGWGVELAHKQWPGPVKQEGDKRSPIGVFHVGPIFGFESKPTTKLKLAYFPLTSSSVCVDDAGSQYYNHLLDSKKIAFPDWLSAEKMRYIPLYYWGAVIQYNTNKSLRSGGSCLFLHSWRGRGRGTAGCIAMAKEQLLALLSRLDPVKKPVLVILNQPAYQFLKKEWDLPVKLIVEQS